jgi:hypothetical protein
MFYETMRFALQKPEPLLIPAATLSELSFCHKESACLRDLFSTWFETVTLSARSWESEPLVLGLAEGQSICFSLCGRLFNGIGVTEADVATEIIGCKAPCASGTGTQRSDILFPRLLCG